MGAFDCGVEKPPFRTFLDDNKLTGKKVAVISGSTSGNGDKCMKQLKEASCADKLVAELSLVDPKAKPTEKMRS